MQMTLEDLGSTEPCTHCGRATYDGKHVQEKHPGRRLPDNFTNGDCRTFVLVRGERLLVCTTCRYYTYGAY